MRLPGVNKREKHGLSGYGVYEIMRAVSDLRPGRPRAPMAGEQTAGCGSHPGDLGRHPRGLSTWTVAAALWACVACPAAAAAEDLSLQDPAWNGLSALAQVAQAQAARVARPARLEVGTLGAQDALLIVHPTAALPVAELAAFIRNGGRVAIADDLGSGSQLLGAFSIERTGLSPKLDALRLRDNRNLLLATAQNDHPLARGVGALVTNHPQALHHALLVPVFGLGTAHEAVVLAGAVGAGRLVAISDSSVFINNMLELQGNERFAQNLVRYLTSERTGTLYLADSHTQLVGSGLGAGSSLRGVANALARLAQLPLPPLAVLALSVGLALLLLFSAATALPRRASYGRRAFLQTPDCNAGYAGRVAAHARARDLAPAVVALKFELESQLVARLQLRGSPRLDEVVDALRAKGTAQPQLAEAKQLLVELDALTASGNRGASRIGRRKFSELVGRGRRILARLPATAHS